MAVMSELAVTSSQAVQLLRAQAVIQMTTNRCETLRIAALAARTGRVRTTPSLASA